MNKQFLTNKEIRYIDLSAESYILLNKSILSVENEHILKNNFEFASLEISPSEFLNRKMYIRDLCNRIVKCYTPVYNSYFNLNFNERQWLLIFGYWLQPFLFDIYEKYLIVLSLDDDAYYVDIGENVEYTDVQTFGRIVGYSSEYQNVIYSELFRMLSKKIIKKRTKHNLNNSELLSKIRRLIKYVLPSGFLKAYRNINNSSVESLPKGCSEVLIVQSRMTHFLEEEISCVLGNFAEFVQGKCFEDYRYYIDFSVKKDDYERMKVFNHFVGNTDFEKMIDGLIQKFIPKLIFEGIPKLYNFALKETEKWQYTKIYHSAHMTEPFLMCSAIMRGKGCLICDIQHSGSYGNMYCCGFAEYNMFDRFLTWGWHDDRLKFGCEFRPVAMSRLPNNERVLFRNKNVLSPTTKNKILFATMRPALTDGAGYYHGELLDEEKEFISNLTDFYRRNLVIRLLEDFSSSELYKWCQKTYPYIKFEAPSDISFSDSVSESAFVVCEYYSSPHLEALLLGRPFIIFDAVKIRVENPNVTDIIGEMRQLGIYMKTGKEAAEQLVIHKDIISWLYSRELSSFFERYKHMLTRADEDIVDLWVKEIKSN